MKIISLNTWGGRIYTPLLEFFDANKNIDIFCLQEIYHGATKEKVEKEFLHDAFNLYSDIQQVLTGHTGYFRPSIGNCYGLALFVKKDIFVESEGDIIVHGVNNYQGGSNHSRNLQYITFENEGKKTLVANIHGLWTGEGKDDTPERIDQSKKIKKFIDSWENQKIVCGDLNLLPNTESIKILEDSGLRNLITENGATSTRTNVYTKPDKFADYIFVSPGITVKDFKVLSDEVSDHTPLYIETE